MEIKDEDYNRIVGFCSKATQIDPQNAAAWHIFSTTNDSASIYYSKKFAKQFRGHAQHLGLAEQSKKNQSYQAHFLLHREFGHKYLPMLISKNNDKKFKHIGLESVHEQSTDLAKKYVAHVTSAVKGLVQQLFLSAQNHSSSNTKTLQTTLRLLKIWFQHGNIPEIEQSLKQGFEKIDLKVWIEVIP